MNDSFHKLGTIGDFSTQDLKNLNKKGTLYPSSPGLKPFDRRATQQNESMVGLKVGHEIINS